MEDRHLRSSIFYHRPEIHFPQIPRIAKVTGNAYLGKKQEVGTFFHALANFFIVKGKVSLEISKFRAMATRIDTNWAPFESVKISLKVT